ncbi:MULTISPECIES: response regulator [Methylobacterium]|jgi:CheY-like chemotaxis protein|uniref:Response regulator n=1 Tax=Methylobacterium longum TaxID=767694 RepID=A0ABT8ANU4_9HYPH|nr:MULTISPECIES: response regulator [Methylobacterium]MCJ2098154.1 response regulator [Methylobacterium sp. E-046]MDN3571488.1 response regulator [Methylobacterium longum]GJE12533.1 Protein-glutamate methylesterase/protein-glutamine glutaminase [Methylobacterium longum]
MGSGNAAAEAALRILVVEDEALIALELECLLDDLGHVTVGVAGNAAEAIAMAKTTAPDVALVDIHLVDGPTGIEVARVLSADRRTTVVFMTANAKRIPPDFAGAIGVIAKPYSERVVASTLDYVADRRAGRSDSDLPDGFSPAPR